MPRIIDPYADRFDPDCDWRMVNKRGKKRRVKKSPRRLTDYFLKVRFKVPSEPCDDLTPPHHHGRYDDDWAPNLEGPDGVRDEVEVTVLGWRNNYRDDADEPAYRVCVWGGDDLGLERDFMYAETEPLWLVLMVLEAFPEPLTKDWLVDVVGMVGA